jgi:MFS family permease
VPTGMFGFIFTTLLFVSAFFSLKAHEIENKFGKKFSFTLMIILPVTGFMLISIFQSYWSWIFIALFYITRGINNVIIDGHINKLISSTYRATAMSAKNLTGRGLFCIVGPIIGLANDNISLEFALIASAILFFTMGIISLVVMRKKNVL